MTKHLFVECWLVLPAADPIVSGDWTIDAQPLDEKHARLAACYQLVEPSVNRPL